MPQPTPSIDDITSNPQYAQLSPAGQQLARVRYFEKYVKATAQYQNALTPQKMKMESAVLGDTSGAPVLDVPAPAPTPLPGPMPSPGNPAGPTAPTADPDSWSSFLTRSRQPGGLLSNESAMTAVGAGAAGLLTGGAAVPMVLGGALGAMGGRATEYAAPGEAPASLGALATDQLGAGQRGALAEMGGASLNKGVGMLAQKLARPRGQLSGDMAGTLSDASELGLDLRVSTIRNSPRAARAEEAAGTGVFASKHVARTIRKEAAQRQRALLDMAESVSPGTSRDMEAVGRALRAGFKREDAATRQAGSDLFERSKDVVEQAAPGGVYAAPNLMRTAANVVGTEAPRAPFSTAALPKAHGILNQFGQPTGVKLPPGRSHDSVSATASEQLRAAGYDPEKVYSFPELLSLTQRLGRAVTGQKDHVARAELTHMWRAASDDLVEAAKTAGAPEAVPLLDAAKSYYKANIIEVFRNRKIIRTMVTADPSEAALTLLRPSTTVEQLRRVRQASGTEFPKLQGAFFDDLATRKGVDASKDFSPQAFLNATGDFSDAQLKIIAGDRYEPLKKFTHIMERTMRNEISSNKTSLASSQITGVLGAAGALAFGQTKMALLGASTLAWPKLLGQAFYTPRGIRWLTVGLQAPPGSKAFVKAASELAGIFATRPNRNDAEGFNFQRALGAS